MKSLHLRDMYRHQQGPSWACEGGVVPLPRTPFCLPRPLIPGASVCPATAPDRPQVTWAAPRHGTRDTEGGPLCRAPGSLHGPPPEEAHGTSH